MIPKGSLTCINPTITASCQSKALRHHNNVCLSPNCFPSCCCTLAPVLRSPRPKKRTITTVCIKISPGILGATWIVNEAWGVIWFDECPSSQVCGCDLLLVLGDQSPTIIRPRLGGMSKIYSLSVFFWLYRKFAVCQFDSRWAPATSASHPDKGLWVSTLNIAGDQAWWDKDHFGPWEF